MTANSSFFLLTISPPIDNPFLQAVTFYACIQQGGRNSGFPPDKRFARNVYFYPINSGSLHVMGNDIPSLFPVPTFTHEMIVFVQFYQSICLYGKITLFVDVFVQVIRTRTESSPAIKILFTTETGDWAFKSRCNFCSHPFNNNSHTNNTRNIPTTSFFMY